MKLTTNSSSRSKVKEKEKLSWQRELQVTQS